MPLPRPGVTGWRSAGPMAIAAVLSLAGCALEVENPKPAQELAQRGRAPGDAGIERLERSS